MRSAPPPNKKRKIKTVHEEKIDFDPAAREEYLTGFHKRKLARRKFAEDENAKKEKEEKLRFRKEVRAKHTSHLITPFHSTALREESWLRKRAEPTCRGNGPAQTGQLFEQIANSNPPPQLRQQRKVDLEKHVSETNRLMRLANGDIPSESESEPDSDSEDPLTGDSVFTGFDDPINESAEYIDEDKYTTVTVETVNINRVGFSRPGEEEAELRKEAALREEKEKEEKKKRVWTKERPKTDRPKKKKVKFRYETKAERKVERMKQGMKKKKLAEKRSKAKEESEKR